MKVGIIGAGASGMMAAVAASEYHAEVTLLEKNDRVGKKLLATGNGKCNLGNLDFGMEKYYCDDKEKLEKLFLRFSVGDTIAFFEENGVFLRSKNGYLYPYSEQASTVLDLFRRLLDKAGVRIVTDCRVTDVSFDEKKHVFAVGTEKDRFTFDRLIAACGGPASQKKGEGTFGFLLAEKFGHSLKPTAPGLVQLCSKDSFIRGMAGVRAQAGLALSADDELLSRQQGELQFTDYGISGIPVFQFSRQAAYALREGKRVFVEINFFPDYEEAYFRDRMCRRFERMREDTLEDFLLGMTNKKISAALIKYAGLKPGDRLSSLGYKRVRELLKLYRSLRVHIHGVKGMENAQVCAGGVAFHEVDDNLQSLRRRGLYFAGELLDVDGICGGYNLQWAWTSGYVAGRSAALDERTDKKPKRKMTEKDF